MKFIWDNMDEDELEAYLAAGERNEIDCAHCILIQKGGEVRHATFYQNTRQHIDLVWSIHGREATLDVKSIKQFRRIDNQVDDRFHWVELKNNQGFPGWLYGEAIYIVFETITNWLFVKREKLVDLVEERLVQVRSEERGVTYHLYDREKYDRDDLITLVPTTDLITIADQVLTLKNIRY